MPPPTSDAPSGLVTFTIRIDGREIPETAEVSAISVIKEVNRLPSAKVQFIDGDPAKQDFPLSSQKLLEPGKVIEILAGYDSLNQTIFKGIILRHRIRASQRGGPTLVLHCGDRARDLTGARKTVSHVEKKDSDIISSLLEGVGLAARVEAAGSRSDTLQYNATDWDFVVTRAEANGKLVFVDGGVVEVKAPGKGGDSVLELTFGDNLFDFETEEVPVLKKESEIFAGAWDPATQKAVSKGNNGKAGMALSVSGDRDKQELDAWTEAALTRQELGRIRGRARIQGAAEVKPGDWVALKGMGERFAGKAFVSAVSHDISGGDWFTDVQFGLSPLQHHERVDVDQPPAGGLLPAVSGLQIGVVTRIIEDPDGQFRVQVNLPPADSRTSEVWARVARLDAGPKRGTIFHPEIGDEVVLGFLSGDPRDPVVLGMLHSKKNALPPDLEPAEKNPKKGIVSRERLQLVFDDKDKVIELATPAGNKITMTEKDKSVTIVDQNKNRVELTSNGILLKAGQNKIELNKSGITLDSSKDLILRAKGNVAIEGVGVEAKAEAQFKAAGNAGAEVSTSGIAIFKGSLVKIN